MTLVLGRVTPDIGFLVADTLLSAQFELKGHRGPVNGKFHALKIQILDPNTAIAFAGDVETSSCLINNLHGELRADQKTDVCGRLFESYLELIRDGANQPQHDCEFLVLQLTPHGRKLAYITKEGVFDRERAYIGDANEYTRMMQLRRPYDPPKTQLSQQPDGTFRVESLVTSDGEIEFAEISNAMERLTHQRKGESIGAISGNVIRVVDARISGQLEYLQSVEASVTPEEGHSGYSVLSSNSGTRGIGMYYRSGRMGFLFVVGDDEPFHKEYAETLNEFIETAKSKYALNLEGGTWDG